MDNGEIQKELGELLKLISSSSIFSSPIRLTILLALLGFKEINFTELEKALGINKSTLSTNLKALEVEGVIQIKYKIDRNRPKQIITITEKGKEIAEKYLSLLEKYKKLL
jgi:DNA-binding MarR family transcriptional regulator